MHFFFRALKQNLIVLLADLFNLCEIHPANCVCYPGMEQLGGKECYFIRQNPFLNWQPLALICKEPNLIFFVVVNKFGQKTQRICFQIDL